MAPEATLQRGSLLWRGRRAANDVEPRMYFSYKFAKWHVARWAQVWARCYCVAHSASHVS